MVFDPGLAWAVWLGLILVFGIVELLTLQFTFMMIAVGCLAALLSGLIGFPWWLQVLVAAFVALLLLLALRPRILAALRHGGDPARSNVDALLGLSGVVTNDFSGNASHVKLANGETWTARSSNPVGPLVEGERVTVTAIEGATAVVVPTERSTS